MGVRVPSLLPRVAQKRGSMKKVLKFFNDVRQELSKVTWLSRKEALTSTVMVVVVVGIFSLVFAAADYIIYHAVRFLVNLGV